MMTNTLIKDFLPERTLGRSGYELVSSQKELTVIMVPFERFSPFANAIDDLYKTMDVPFNLIVVEGNAPESVRESLEKRQRMHKNITIIYSNRQTSIGAAINLATPHLKTKYAFIMDNDMRIPRGVMGNLLREAIENRHDIVCPQNCIVRSRWINAENEKVQSLGIRTCFLVSREAIRELGKSDEKMTPFTIGIDLRMTAEKRGIAIWNETAVCMELNGENFLWPMDAALYSFQWSEERFFNSLKGLETKWGIHLEGEDYAAWIKSKQKDLEKSKNVLSLLTGLVSKVVFLAQQEKRPKETRGFLLPIAA